MSTTKLDLFNKALRIVGERKLANLEEERKPRRLLDDVWDQGGVNYCLEQAQWHFAMRTTLMDYNPAVEPPFGYKRAFNKPEDWIITSAVCSDEFFNSPITQYADEAGYWYTEYDLIYIKYVSNNDLYGNNMLKWPETFENYVATYFASEIVLGVNSDMKMYGNIMAMLDKTLLAAKGRAAMAEPTSFPAQGGWTKAREDGGRGRERGNRHSLYG